MFETLLHVVRYSQMSAFYFKSVNVYY